MGLKHSMLLALRPLVAITACISFLSGQTFGATLACRADPTIVKSGESSTITAKATSPDGAPFKSYAYGAKPGSIFGSGASATLDTTGLPPGTVTVTVTATDSNGLTATCSTSVDVIAELKCVGIEDWGECTFKDPKNPSRVDDDCADTLDKMALRLQQMPSDSKLQVVGYTDEQETVKMPQMAAQRAVNVKYYLVEDELGPKLNASLIQPRQGGTKGKATHFYLVPGGALCQGQVVEGTPVDESQVKGQSRKSLAQ